MSKRLLIVTLGRYETTFACIWTRGFISVCSSTVGRELKLIIKSSKSLSYVT